MNLSSKKDAPNHHCNIWHYWTEALSVFLSSTPTRMIWAFYKWAGNKYLFFFISGIVEIKFFEVHESDGCLVQCLLLPLCYATQLIPFFVLSIDTYILHTYVCLKIIFSYETLFVYGRNYFINEWWVLSCFLSSVSVLLFRRLVLFVVIIPGTIKLLDK